MKKHIYVLLTLLGILTACAHVNVAKERTYATPKAGSAAVYFYRESHFVGGATSYNIWNNNTQPPVKLGSLQNGSYFYIYLKPGHYRFVVNGEVEGSAEFDIEAGKIYYVQNRIDMGFWAARPKLTEVTKSEGERQIKDPEMKMTTL